MIFPPVAPGEEASLGVHEFGEIIANHLTQEYALPNNLDLRELRLVFFGDPAGAARPPRVGDSPKETRSCFDILNKGIEIVLGSDEDGNKKVIRKPGWGCIIIPGKVGITDRLEAVRARLMMLLSGQPALIVDCRAESLKEAFLGGYHYKQRNDGHYDYWPNKDWYSHQCDAVGYVATKLFSQTQNEDEDEEYIPKQEFSSHASNRYNY